MSEDSKVIRLRQPDEIDDPLTAVLRTGARRLLEQAIEAEVEAFLASMKDLKLPDGRDRIVRHGHGPERMIQTGIGPVEVRRAKVRDRGGDDDDGGEGDDEGHGSSLTWPDVVGRNSRVARKAAGQARLYGMRRWRMV